MALHEEAGLRGKEGTEIEPVLNSFTGGPTELCPFRKGDVIYVTKAS